MRSWLIIFLCLLQFAATAQYAPQAGLPGSTAISAAGGAFTGWATHCSVQRGYMDIADQSLGYASLGDSTAGIGAANGSIVSLGDSGVATLTFDHPIYNGSGADFAVFENGFANPSDASMAFLELAFVEVSSDGVHFTRFPSSSNTPLTSQIPGAGVYMDASLINNLAGKYIAGYGTPFDLQELADSPNLDVNNIIAVRVVDVVGSTGAHASHDASGHIINDPYPTSFPSGGFDLDAVGAIHQLATGIGQVSTLVALSVYPNPATDKITIAVNDLVITGNITAMLTTVTGIVLQKSVFSTATNSITVAQYPAGMYYLVLSDAKGNKWVEKIIKS